MNYLKFDFQTRELGLEEPVIRLYPLVCLHVGAAQCDMKFIKAQIKRIEEDENGRAIYLGDGGECVVLGSKGDIYKQLLSPQEQHDLLVEILAPIKDKLLFGVRGNHGHRVYKLTGLDFDANLCHRLGMPYMGVSTFANLTINRSSYDTFWHHGADSGVSVQSKINKAEKFLDFVNVDAAFTAHSHACIDLPPRALLSCDNANCKVTTRLRRQYICGSAYDSRSGYAEEKGYNPMLPSWICVEFDGRIIQGRARYSQTAQIVRSTGDYELNHDYIKAVKIDD